VTVLVADVGDIEFDLQIDFVNRDHGTVVLKFVVLRMEQVAQVAVVVKAWIVEEVVVVPVAFGFVTFCEDRYVSEAGSHWGLEFGPPVGMALGRLVGELQTVAQQVGPGCGMPSICGLEGLPELVAGTAAVPQGRIVAARRIVAQAGIVVVQVGTVARGQEGTVAARAGTVAAEVGTGSSPVGMAVVPGIAVAAVVVVLVDIVAVVAGNSVAVSVCHPYDHLVQEHEKHHALFHVLHDHLFLYRDLGPFLYQRRNLLFQEFQTYHATTPLRLLPTTLLDCSYVLKKNVE
jgi:hypothetical protein